MEVFFIQRLEFGSGRSQSRNSIKTYSSTLEVNKLWLNLKEMQSSSFKCLSTRIGMPSYWREHEPPSDTSMTRKSSASQGGAMLGRLEGWCEGYIEGKNDGETEGEVDGDTDGETDGIEVG
mmetsp:Transcript_6605/g.9335  ORF Transcript_6605/g.9335 Transcript_6605/m.9335 type:complete len:121 (+) Transcript_6605:258-620(+)